MQPPANISIDSTERLQTLIRSGKIIDFGFDDIGYYCYLEDTIFVPEYDGKLGDNGYLIFNLTARLKNHPEYADKLGSNAFNYFLVDRCVMVDGVVRHYAQYGMDGLHGFMPTGLEVIQIRL